MDREFTQWLTELEMRTQHKPMHWGHEDQRDFEHWTRHDNEKHEKRGYGAYALCRLCQGV